MLGSRIYLVNSVSTIASIQKNNKTLAFEPIQAKFSARICGASNEAYNILIKAMDVENGIYPEIYRAMHPSLAPGVGLDAMNRTMIQSVSRSIESIKPAVGSSTAIGLVSWLRHHVTLATTQAVYGPKNPFQDANVEGAFWYTFHF